MHCVSALSVTGTPLPDPVEEALLGYQPPWLAQEQRERVQIAAADRERLVSAKELPFGGAIGEPPEAKATSRHFSANPHAMLMPLIFARAKTMRIDLGDFTMTQSSATAASPVWNIWRIGRWTIAAILLIIPLVMMQFMPDWNWTIGDFLVAGTAIGAVGLLYELAERSSRLRAYRIGAAIALGACFLLVWSTLVRDDGNGIGFFLVVLASALGTFAGRTAADAMARTMLGVAVMQALLGLAVATAPSVAQAPGAVAFYLLYTGFFCITWLASAACFHVAARTDTSEAPSDVGPENP